MITGIGIDIADIEEIRRLIEDKELSEVYINHTLQAKDCIQKSI